jgi:cell division septation protein DedD
VGAFALYKAAKTLIDKLNKKGFPTYCDFHDSEKGQSFFRVRIVKIRIGDGSESRAI